MSTKLETYLKEVKDRAEAATPGPWRLLRNEEMDQFFVCDKDDKIILKAFDFAYDCELAAHARTDIPTLLKLVEAQQEIIDNHGWHLGSCISNSLDGIDADD